MPMGKHYGGISNAFVNLMFSIMLILGVLDWAGISNTLQYVLFIFTYILLITYWMTHRSYIKQFPPKRVLGVMIDITAMAVLFLIIKAALLPLGFYFAALAILRAVDALGITRIISEYISSKKDVLRLKSRRGIYFFEAAIYLLFEAITFHNGLPYVFGMTAMILTWLFGRIFEGSVKL